MQVLLEESNYRKAGHVGCWKELSSLVWAAQGALWPLKGSRGCSDSSCHLLTEADGLRDSQQLPVGSVTPSLPGTGVRQLHAPGLSGCRAAMGGLGQSLAQAQGSSPAPATSAWRLHCSRAQMGLGLQHWAGDSSHFSRSTAPVLSLAASSQLSLGAPGQRALPLHLLILHRVLMVSSHS